MNDPPSLTDPNAANMVSPRSASVQYGLHSLPTRLQLPATAGRASISPCSSEVHPDFLVVRIDLRNAYNEYRRAQVLQRMAAVPGVASLVPLRICRARARALFRLPPSSRRGEALWERVEAGSGSLGAASSESAASQPRGAVGRVCGCSVGRGFGRRVVVRVCRWVWMVVRFVCVIRVSARALVCPVCVRC